MLKLMGKKIFTISADSKPVLLDTACSNNSTDSKQSLYLFHHTLSLFSIAVLFLCSMSQSIIFQSFQDVFLSSWVQQVLSRG